MITLGIILLVVAFLCASTYFVSIFIDCYNESVLKIIMILGGVTALLGAIIIIVSIA